MKTRLRCRSRCGYMEGRRGGRGGGGGCSGQEDTGRDYDNVGRSIRAGVWRVCVKVEGDPQTSPHTTPPTPLTHPTPPTPPTPTLPHTSNTHHISHTTPHYTTHPTRTTYPTQPTQVGGGRGVVGASDSGARRLIHLSSRAGSSSSGYDDPARSAPLPSLSEAGGGGALSRLRAARGGGGAHPPLPPQQQLGHHQSIGGRAGGSLLATMPPSYDPHPHHLAQTSPQLLQSQDECMVLTSLDSMFEGRRTPPVVSATSGVTTASSSIAAAAQPGGAGRAFSPVPPSFARLASEPSLPSESSHHGRPTGAMARGYSTVGGGTTMQMLREGAAAVVRPAAASFTAGMVGGVGRPTFDAAPPPAPMAELSSASAPSAGVGVGRARSKLAQASISPSGGGGGGGSDSGFKLPNIFKKLMS